MTTTEVAAAGTARRYADPAREVVLSCAALVGAAAAYTASWVLLVRTDIAFEVLIWVFPTVYATVLALAVAWRARSSRRRLWATAAMVLALAAMLVVPALLGPRIDPDRLFAHRWLTEAAGHAAPMLVLVAWGVARRHGTWWWTGLVPAFGLHLASPHLRVAFVDLAPEHTWSAGLIALGAAEPVLGGAACWLVDVLTTRPLARRGTLEA